MSEVLKLRSGKTSIFIESGIDVGTRMWELIEIVKLFVKLL